MLGEDLRVGAALPESVEVDARLLLKLGALLRVREDGVGAGAGGGAPEMNRRSESSIESGFTSTESRSSSRGD